MTTVVMLFFLVLFIPFVTGSWFLLVVTGFTNSKGWFSLALTLALGLTVTAVLISVTMAGPWLYELFGPTDDIVAGFGMTMAVGAAFLGGLFASEMIGRLES